MLRVVLAVLLVLYALSVNLLAEEATATQQQPDKLDIFLFIGQSNMAGRANSPSRGVIKAVDNVFLLNKEDLWVKAEFGGSAANPSCRDFGYNRFSTVESPNKPNLYNCGVGFALELLKQRPQAKIGLVMNARGGTTIAQWQKGAPSFAKDLSVSMFDEAVRRTKAAQKTGTLRAIFWHQGESDARSKNYGQQLQRFVKDLRSELGVSEQAVPFIAGQLLPNPEFVAINQQLLDIAKVIPNSACITNEGFVDKGDKLHFDMQTQMLLGQRYAQAYLAGVAGNITMENQK